MIGLSRLAAPAICALLLAPLAIADASAQPASRGRGEGYGWGPGMMMGPGMMGGRNFEFMCNPRSAGMAEWRTQRIETELRPTEPQAKLLEDLKQASAKAAEVLNATCGGDVPGKASERLAVMEKRAEAGLQAIRLVRPAFDKFHASLDDAQKAKLDAIGPRRWGWRNWRWRS